jgi:hypothetical protein
LRRVVHFFDLAPPFGSHNANASISDHIPDGYCTATAAGAAFMATTADPATPARAEQDLHGHVQRSTAGRNAFRTQQINRLISLSVSGKQRAGTMFRVAGQLRAAIAGGFAQLAIS